MQQQKSTDQKIIEIYHSFVAAKHPDGITGWPVISGYDLKSASFGEWRIYVFIHTGKSHVRTSDGIGELPSSVIGFQSIDSSNKSRVRERIGRHFRLGRQDAIFMLYQNGDIKDDLEFNLLQHEIEMGLCPMRIFLSHKGADKPMVREFKRTLEELGFDPWLDEDAMTAGVELERGILQGFKDSCAAVFFVTPLFQDEAYLASEVNYAIQEKRAKHDRFAIVTLVFSDGPSKGVVPDLLKQYVWKEPVSQIEAFRELIRAIPIRVGSLVWK